MKIYRTGLISFLSTVMSVLVFYQIMNNFYKEQPIIFYISNIILIIMFISLIVISIIDVKNKKENDFKMLDIMRTLIFSIIMYSLALKYSSYYIVIIIVFIGVIDIFLIRKKSGLIKR
ncbi:hypothetical protein [Helcococcus kunzii]|uniref:hypothetical protein n=1 Tax=Helcococcus kunzii TaxID=40091 RepID=UPI0024AE62F8|nr:hypothetical protein [Helcococcus kunzii]